MLCSNDIKRRAAELGFAACGMARAEAVDGETVHAFDAWINEGCHGEMGYMARYREQRMNPRYMDEGTEEYNTVICLALPYAQECDAPVAAYALGPDYHEVMRDLLRQMGVEGRICVDTAPLMEKYWAVKAGIGWVGRNHQLVLPGHGSAFFLGEILCADHADVYDTPLTPTAAPGAMCGDCHLCEEACPMGALRRDGVLDARRCLSYLTIEYRGELPPGTLPAGRSGGKAADGEGDADGMFYGCDRCMKACPHYQRGAVAQTHFPMNPRLATMTADEWMRLTREEFNALFRHSAVKRTKYEGLMRNIAAWRQATGQ